MLTFVPFHHCIPALPCPCSALELTLTLCHGGCYRLFLLRFFRGSSALPLAVELNCPTSTPSVPFPSRLFCSLLLLAIFFCFCVSVSCISFLVGVRFRCSALHCAQLLKSNTQYAFVSFRCRYLGVGFDSVGPSHPMSSRIITLTLNILFFALPLQRCSLVVPFPSFGCAVQSRIVCKGALYLVLVLVCRLAMLSSASSCRSSSSVVCCSVPLSP